MISACIACWDRWWMMTRTAPALRASLDATGEPHELVIATDTPPGLHLRPTERTVPAKLPFSVGAWRNLAVNASTGDVVLVIDVDMIVPVGYVGELAAIVRSGQAAFPLYMRESTPAGPPLTKGIGFGNCAFSRDMWVAACAETGGRPYMEKTVWGGEDTQFCNLLLRRRRPVWRKPIAGFVHLYHSKAAGSNTWYTRLAEGSAG